MSRTDATLKISEPAQAPGKPLPVVQEHIRFQVAPHLAHVMTPAGYEAASAYFSRKLDQPVEFVPGGSQGVVNTAIEDGTVAVGLTGSAPFVLAHRQYGLVPLAAPVVAGQVKHSSCLVVRAGSPVRNISDLRGKSFAFTDPLSIAGGLVPAAALARFGAKPGEFFRAIVYTHSHERSIRAVADGRVDAAAVDSLVFDDAIAAAPDLARKVDVVWRSVPFMNGPVAVHPRTPEGFRTRVRAVFVGMRHDPAAKPVLETMGVDGWEAVSAEHYKMVETMMRITGAI